MVHKKVSYEVAVENPEKKARPGVLWMFDPDGSVMFVVYYSRTIYDVPGAWVYFHAVS